MKRITALLLVFTLLLTNLALSESYRIEFSLSVADEEKVQSEAVALAQQFAALVPETNVQSLSDLLFRIAKTTSFTVQVQEDAAAIDVIISGYPILDLRLYDAENAALMVSSLMPGYAMSFAHQPAADAMAALDIQAALESIQSNLIAWIEALHVETSEGVFTGDAYDNGARCTTFTLNERDLINLTSAIMSPDVQAWLEKALSSSAADVLLQQLTIGSNTTSAQHQYTYLIRLIDDVDGELIGASLTVMEDEAQVATASLGIGQDVLDLVVGIGMPQENYWFDVQVDIARMDAMRCDTIQFREFRAPKDETYAYAIANREPESWVTWAFTTYESGNKQHLDALLVNELNGHQLRLRSSFSEQPLELIVETSDLPLTLRLSCAVAADGVPAFPEGLIVFSADAETEEALSAMDELTKRLAARLMKVIPMDLLMLFQ